VYCIYNERIQQPTCTTHLDTVLRYVVTCMFESVGTRGVITVFGIVAEAVAPTVVVAVVVAHPTSCGAMTNVLLYAPSRTWTTANDCIPELPQLHVLTVASKYQVFSVAKTKALLYHPHRRMRTFQQ